MTVDEVDEVAVGTVGTAAGAVFVAVVVLVAVRRAGSTDPVPLDPDAERGLRGPNTRSERFDPPDVPSPGRPDPPRPEPPGR